MEASSYHSRNSLRQDEVLHPAPKIFKEFCQINWSCSSKEVYDFIRGLSPYPVAYSFLEILVKKELLTKIYTANYEIVMHQSSSLGKYYHDGKTYIKVAAKDGYIQILELQISGKKRLSTGEFLRGFHEDMVAFS